MIVWEQEHIIRIPYMMPASLVESGSRKALVPTAFTGDMGINALTSTRAGSVSLLFNLRLETTGGRREQKSLRCIDTLPQVVPNGSVERVRAQTLLSLPGLTGASQWLYEAKRTPPMSRSQVQKFNKKYKKKYGEKFEKGFDSATYWKQFRVRAAFETLCEGTRKNGQPCQKIAEAGGRYCYQHGRKT